MVNNLLGTTEDLIDSARDGNLERIEKDLAKGADINGRDEFGGTALFAATEQGNTELVYYLLTHGADPNITDNDNETPLLFAVLNNDIETVQCLLDFGVDPNIKDKTGKTPLDYVQKNDYKEIVELLIKMGAVNSRMNEELRMAVMEGNMVKIRQLVEAGADVKLVTPDKNTLLHLAYIYHNKISNPFELISYLLQKGVNINAGDCSGTTVLMMAVENNDLLYVDYFISKGADPNAKDISGNTAFTIAKRNYEDMMRLLNRETDYEHLVLGD